MYKNHVFLLAFFLTSFLHAQHDWHRTNVGGGGAIVVVGGTADGTIVRFAAGIGAWFYHKCAGATSA